MVTTAESFQTAIAHHQAGRLREAEALYRQILQAEPYHADALHLLGLLAHQAVRHDTAVKLISQAIALRGDQPAFHSNLGEVYRAMGKLTEAGQSFRQALRLNADMPEARNNLGNVLRATGHTQEALEAFRTAIRLRPEFAEAHNNLGQILESRGDLEGAIACHRRAIELNPSFADAHSSLGTALSARGNSADAIRCFEQALQLAPRNGQYHLNLGVVYQSQRKFDQAIACYREALRLAPATALAHNNLGVALREQGHLDEAISAYREGVRVQPDFAEVHFNLGVALEARRELAAAEAEFETAVRLKPGFDDAWIHHSRLLESQGRLDDALALWDRALQQNPEYALAHFSQANIYKLKGMAAQAIASFQVVLRFRPDYAAVYMNMAAIYQTMNLPDQSVDVCLAGLKFDPNNGLSHGNLAIGLHQQGRNDEAIAAYRRAVELQPDDAGGHSNLLYALNFQPDSDPARLFADHLAWARRHAEPMTATAAPHTNDRTIQRRLRIGYLSPYFRQHAVNAFAEPMIAAHDHGQFEIFCYSDVETQLVDPTTSRVRASADQWRVVTGKSDAEIAQLVRDDAIDILVDLTGHIGGNRLLTFARRPAPIQVTYLGYQNTTGMSAMDYRLTDERADPPGLTDRFYTERLVRLPRAFYCYRPPDEAPPITPLPALASGRVTFGSFNNFPKITRQVLDTWFEILTRVPNSRLLVLAYRGGYLERHLRGRATQRGIDPARIDLHDKCLKADYLRLQQQADIAARCFPVQRAHDHVRRDLDGRSGRHARGPQLRLAFRR